MQEPSADPQQGSIVPSGPSPKRIAPRVAHGSLMLVLGCLVSLFLPFAGAILMAYGMRELAEASGARGVAISFAESAVLIAAALVAGVGYAALLAPVLVCSAAVVLCMWRGATVTNMSVAVVIGSLVSFGIDAAIAAISGVSVSETAVAYLMAALRESVGTGVEGDLLLAQIQPVVEVVWPLIYVTGAAFDCLVAGIGSYLMGVRCTGEPGRPSLARFDAPMWSVAVLALAVVGFGASFTGIPESGLVRTVSTTVFMSVRIIFALQGFGVVSALMTRSRMGCLTRTVCIFFLFWSEMMLFAMSIVGLIDIWANFRKLPRDGSRDRVTQ